ncbi:hypothetical protein C8Q78DRAFT_411818 [Trametes maxima]|nr:hypothetical protein C8Q78DRAFT_411818 [Trametes maxima]
MTPNRCFYIDLIFRVDTQCVCKNIGRLDSAFVLLGCFEMKCHDGADEGLHAIEAICGQSMTGIVASAAPTNTSTTISSTVLASSSARPYHTETITVSQTTITDHLAPTSSITTSSSTLALAPATASGPTSDSATKTVSTSSLEASPSRASFSESPTNTSLTNAPSAPPAPMSNTNDANPQGSSSNAASKYGSTFWTGELGVKNTAMVIVCVYVLIAAV